MPIEIQQDPEIKVDQIKIPSHPQKKDKKTIDERGYKNQPIISINGQLVGWGAVQNFDLQSKEFIPKINIAFEDEYDLFTKDAVIVNGDLISIYLREPSGDIKPIRMDFYITKSKPMSSYNQNTIIYLTGIAHIPLLWKEISIASDELGSSEQLLELVKRDDLKLGYATNATSTNDKMSWISPFFTYYEFIKHITTHAYVDKDSFFGSFIDFYYNMNFINFNQEFPPTLEMKQFGDSVSINDGINTEKLDYTIITNLLNVNDSQLTFNNPVLLEESGQYSIHQGYNKQAHVYSHKDREFINTKIEPLTTESNQDLFNRRGRLDNDYYSEINRNINLGVQFDNGNTHEHFQLAEQLNTHNLVELSKTQLQVDLPTPNLSFYRYQKITVIFAKNFTDTSDPIFNPYLSGNYLINNISFIKLDNGELGQRLRLTRREWPNKIQLQQ